MSGFFDGLKWAFEVWAFGYDGPPQIALIVFLAFLAVLGVTPEDWIRKYKRLPLPVMAAAILTTFAFIGLFTQGRLMAVSLLALCTIFFVIFFAKFIKANNSKPALAGTQSQYVEPDTRRAKKMSLWKKLKTWFLTQNYPLKKRRRNRLLPKVMADPDPGQESFEPNPEWGIKRKKINIVDGGVAEPESSEVKISRRPINFERQDQLSLMDEVEYETLEVFVDKEVKCFRGPNDTNNSLTLAQKVFGRVLWRSADGKRVLVCHKDINEACIGWFDIERVHNTDSSEIPFNWQIGFIKEITEQELGVLEYAPSSLPIFVQNVEQSNEESSGPRQVPKRIGS